LPADNEKKSALSISEKIYIFAQLKLELSNARNRKPLRLGDEKNQKSYKNIQGKINKNLRKSV
jgi:hypothetical protein